MSGIGSHRIEISDNGFLVFKTGIILIKSFENQSLEAFPLGFFAKNE